MVDAGTPDVPVAASPGVSPTVEAGLTPPMVVATATANPDEALWAKADAIVDAMSVDDQVSQMFLFMLGGTWLSPADDAFMRTYRPGGVVLVQGNIGSAEALVALTAAIHATNPDFPPLIGTDQEGGSVVRLAGDPAPGAVDLGLADDTATLKAGQDRGNFLVQYGIDANFAPVADVAFDPSSSMYWRSFGSDPKVVAQRVGAMVRGSNRTALVSAAKHFPGHGRTAVDSHVALPVIDVGFEEWRKTDALPFMAAIEAGVEMVMVGHLLLPKWDPVEPMSLSPASVSALRDGLGFEGAIITDDLGMAAVSWRSPLELVDQAVLAGIDGLMFVNSWGMLGALIDHLRERVRDGSVSEDRIRASARRMVWVKLRRGVMG